MDRTGKPATMLSVSARADAVGWAYMELEASVRIRTRSKASSWSPESVRGCTARDWLSGGTVAHPREKSIKNATN